MSDGAHKVKADIEENSWKIFFGLVDVGYSLAEGQAVKLIFFAPCLWSTNYLLMLKNLILLYSDLITSVSITK